MSEAFAHVIRCYRLAARLTQTDLAPRAGLSREAISALEGGLRQMPRRDTGNVDDPRFVLPTLARAGTTVADLHDFVSTRDVLLILDRFEHVSDTALELEGLVTSAQDLKVLVTTHGGLHMRARMSCVYGDSTNKPPLPFLERGGSRRGRGILRSCPPNLSKPTECSS